MAAKAPFKFWSFFFSTRGRVSRVQFSLFEIPALLMLLAVPWIVVPLLQQQRGVTDSSWMIVSAAAGLVTLLMMWPRFSVAVKRLHDLGWAWWPALPILLPLLNSLAAGVANYLDVSSDFQTEYGRWAGFYWIGNGLGFYTIGLIVALALLPGSKEENRYGPPNPRNRQTRQDVF
ncbi:DUF805 domain-containing protein [Asticcacaulis sp. AC402]|uniref:DUF805 domain-containing protein n=1 Tax=Asticcacaulis sp. AC402 TaxID=1282361 RepID=UPI0003C3BA51|nr:DUF805 domain-containing protein [Asticcacaulis sp. AC402]ESQ76350.1 hypothetical protein ABAC402_04425 [Asticcacaulis sp. AC402]